MDHLSDSFYGCFFGLNGVSPNSHGKALTLNIIVFSQKKDIKVKCDHNSAFHPVDEKGKKARKVIKVICDHKISTLAL